jgi:hypothetical protein
MAETQKLFEETVLSRAGWISSVLIACVLLALTMSLLRYTKGTEFEILKIKFPISAFPLACVAYTLAHLYCTILFVLVCRQVGHSRNLWQALTLKGPIVFAGMLPHQIWYAIPLKALSIPIDKIQTNYPTLWLFYGFCVVLYFGFTWACEVANYSKLKQHV